MQRVHLEAMLPATAPAQLAIELAPPEWYRQPAPAVPGTPSWRAPSDEYERRGASSSQPLGSFVIELDLT